MTEVYQNGAMANSRHASLVETSNYDAIIPCQSVGNLSVEELHPTVDTTHHRGKYWAQQSRSTNAEEYQEHPGHEPIFANTEP